jgi:hypothetical protein
MQAALPVHQQGLRCRRTKFGKEQYKVLIEVYERNPDPGFSIREELSRLIQIPEPQIQSGFRTRMLKYQREARGALVERWPGHRSPSQVLDCLRCSPPTT